MKQIYAILLTFLFTTLLFVGGHYYCYGKLIPDKLKKGTTKIETPEIVDKTTEQVNEPFYDRFRPSY